MANINARTSDEISIRELRSALADVLHEVSIGGRTFYITNHGRRVAAIVPLADERPERQQTP